MAMMFGRFEILSELSKSEAGLVYKATDTETNQTVALKTLNLEPLGEGTSDFVNALLAEGESTRDLASQNVAVLYGAGEIENQFCAAMEYVQGNSVATMLARKEGFSIWDLLDITRQVCAGLEYAASLGVVHHSLEPAKVMVQWDGLVKILGYGISSMSLVGAETGAGLGRLLPYCSPEQVQGEAIDLRSNLFTWGAVLYEMITDRKAFDAEDPAALTNQIQNEMPPSPASLNPKIHPGVSALIMKALAKNPEERYQAARDLVADLEKCKEGGSKQAPGAKRSAPAAKTVVPPATRAAAVSKFVSAAPKAEESEIGAASSSSSAPRKFAEPSIGFSSEPKAAAAAAGAGAGTISGRSSGIDSGARFVDESMEAPVVARKSPVLSAASVEPERETQPLMAPVDPLMAESAPASGGGRSFSDMDELPPMKEPVFAPPPPPLAVPEVPEPSPLAQLRRREEKPRVQPREVAEKAIKEIKTVPPKLMIYSVMGAVGLILVVMIALFFHVRSEDEDTTAAPRPTAAVKPQPVAPAPVETQPAAPQSVTPEPAQEEQPEVTVRQIEKRAPTAGRKRAPAPVTAVIPGQVQIDSTPQGAQIQIDGKTDAAWMTPFNLTGLSPGQHMITVSKSGYSAETRAVDITSASKAFVAFHLAPVNALLVLNSTPSGANVILDGKETGRVTPAQFAVEKGSHTILLRKQGFLDESTTTDLGPGQNFQFAPALRALGNVDDIRSVGKFKKLFGGNGGDSTAGMGSVSVRTQPKGAQIAINRRLLEKPSPTEFMVGPGAYEVDITLTGFKPVHKVISVEKGGKVAIDEILERQ